MLNGNPVPSLVRAVLTVHRGVAKGLGWGPSGCERVEEVAHDRSTGFCGQVNSSVSWLLKFFSSCWILSTSTKPELLLGPQCAESWGTVSKTQPWGDELVFLVRYRKDRCEPSSFPYRSNTQNLYKEVSVLSECHSDMPLCCFRSGLGLWPHPSLRGSQPKIPVCTPFAFDR